MRPSRHIAVSVSIGAGVWFFTGSISAALTSFIAGFIIDVDHAIDYVVNNGWEGFSLRKVYLACEDMEKRRQDCAYGKLYIIFHSLELSAILWMVYFITSNIYILAVTLSYSAHLLMDSMGNTIGLRPYFFTYRAMSRFDARRYFRA